MKNGLPIDSFYEMITINYQNKFKGNIIDGKRNGKCIINENGKEYNVVYENGLMKMKLNKNAELKEMKKRTFDGMRMMIIGCEHVGKTSFTSKLISSFSSLKNETKECILKQLSESKPF